MVDTITVVMGFIIAALVASFAAYLMWAQRRFDQLEGENSNRAENLKLQLAAYERLTLFAERIKLNNLVNRLYDSSFDARQMQQILLQAIRDEYDHNITQQLFIKPEIWEALTKMKEQNMFIINQLAQIEAPDATALDFNKKILEFSLSNPNATMNSLVLDAMQFEVKNLLK